MRKQRDSFINAHNYQFSIDSILPKLAADKAGMKKNDKVMSINNQPVESFGHFREIISENAGKSIRIVVERDSNRDTLNLTVDSIGFIGIVASLPPYQFNNYSFLSAIKYGTSDAIELLAANTKGLGKIFQGKEKVTESVQGPIGIAKIYGGVWDWRKFWSITGMISMILAFMNILPIPALDGGHVIFLIIEAVTRKKFSDKFMERVQMVGMVILIALMIFVFGNDIFKLFK